MRWAAELKILDKYWGVLVGLGGLEPPTSQEGGLRNMFASRIKTLSK
jgi:hypothetical protein